MKIAIVNYGVGNLKSLQNACKYLGFTSQLVSRPEELAGADKIILPGVGAFGYAMTNIRNLFLDEALTEKFHSGTPILGICLGMQLLLSASEENGEFQGLNFIPGRVKKLKCDLKIPHIGWNKIKLRRSCPLTADLPENGFGYFVHSYICIPKDAGAIVATTDYGTDICSVISYGNVFGTQFHPEKSQEMGLQIFINFAEL